MPLRGADHYFVRVSDSGFGVSADIAFAESSPKFKGKKRKRQKMIFISYL